MKPSARSSNHVPTTLFSFGYWGSGSATRELVDAVNEAEALRGFGPPLWVDIRISRAVRAAGFRDNAFEKLVGAHYVHLQRLGNTSVSTGQSGITIQDPAAADELLDWALADSSRRVIFFCACELPIVCHRHVVAKLVLNAAKRRHARVTVIEWPGGEPTALTLEVPQSVLRGVERGSQKTLAVPPSLSPGEAASVPWASTGLLLSASDQVPVLLGPAQFTARGRHLRVLAIAPHVNDAAAFRNKNGYAGMTSVDRRQGPVVST